VAPAGAVTAPFYSYTPADAGSPTASISALALRESDGMLFFGDYSVGKIFSLPTAASAPARTTVKIYAYPSDLFFVPGIGIVYTDVGRGTVASLPNTLHATPSATPSRGPAAASGAARAALTAAAALAAIALAAAAAV
jgi:hypothetical protein